MAWNVDWPRRLRKAAAMPVLLTCLYGSTALLWYTITPPYEGPDENAHFAFIRFLAVKRRLPDARLETRAGWDYHEWMHRKGS